MRHLNFKFPRDAKLNSMLPVYNYKYTLRANLNSNAVLPVPHSRSINSNFKADVLGTQAKLGKCLWLSWSAYQNWQQRIGPVKKCGRHILTDYLLANSKYRNHFNAFLFTAKTHQANLPPVQIPPTSPTPTVYLWAVCRMRLRYNFLNFGHRTAQAMKLKNVRRKSVQMWTMLIVI